MAAYSIAGGGGPEKPQRDITQDHAAVMARFAVAVEALQKQRDREVKALEFQTPDKQWPSDVKSARQAQTIGGATGIALPERPMLSIPTLDQPIQLVLNQERNAHLGVQIHAVSEEADDDTAEKLQGLYRRIEVDSRANLARTWAHERAVRAGLGAYRILTVYDADSPEKDDQKIIIRRMLHQEAVCWDPFAEEPDWCDARDCWIASWVPLKQAQRMKKTVKGADGKRQTEDSALKHYDAAQFLELVTETPSWAKGEGDEAAVLVVEHFHVHMDEDTGERWVSWRKMNAVEHLEEQGWPGQYIPVVMTIGRELIPCDAERRWVGIVEPNMDAARMFNYAASAAVESAALEPKAPFDVDPQEIQGFEAYWQQANIRNLPYLPRHKFKGIVPYGPINRIQVDGSKLQINIGLLQQAREFIHAGTGAYAPSLGDTDKNVRTKGATLALQQQHDAGTSHWLDNLAQISMTYEAKVILDLIPHIYDRPGRIARILDAEDNPETVMFNAPFVTDPKTKRPKQLQAGPDGSTVMPPGVQPEQVKQYDLTKGRYAVAVSIGKAYKSRIEQGADELGQLFQAEPQLFQLLGDIYLKFRDFPGHTEAAERVKKMLPPQLQGGDQGDPAQQVQAMQQQLQAASEQIKLLSKELEERVKQVETDEAKAQAQVQIEELKGRLEIQLKEMDNAAKIRIAEINAATKGYIAEAEHAAQHEEQALNIEAQAVEGHLEREQSSVEADRTRQHEDAQAEADRQFQAVEGDVSREHERTMQKEKPQPTKGTR